MTQTRKPFRLMYKFWLNMDKPEERDIGETIEDLKAQRSFSRVVRDGIRLIVDLKRGNVDVLLALFPWIDGYFRDKYTTPTPPDTSGLQRDIEILKQMVASQQSSGYAHKPAQLTAGNNPSPPDDDAFLDGLTDSLEVKQDETAAARSSENMRNTLWAMADGKGAWASDKPANGKRKADFRQQGNAKAMVVPAIMPPSPDDFGELENLL